MAVTKFEKPMGTEVQSLSEQFGTKQQSITKTTFTGTIYARKAGNVVVLNFYDFKVPNASTTLSGVLPSDYRPSSGQTRGILQLGNSTGIEFISITTSGDISVDNSDTSKYYYGSITYII